MAKRVMIARRVAKEFSDGDVVNLVLVCPPWWQTIFPKASTSFTVGKRVLEWGRTGAEEVDEDIVNAGGQPRQFSPGQLL